MTVEKTRYIVCVPITPQADTVVGISKRKGPAFLRNKLTFPGGHIEAGETPAVAAARELKEETGIELDASAFVQFKEVQGADYELFFMAVVTRKVHHARQMEEEPVWLLDVSFHQRQAKVQPEIYAPDFQEVLALAVEVAQSSQQAAA